MLNKISNKISFSPLDYSLSGSALKVIAILSMVSDHIAYFFLNQDSPFYEEMRCFGRIAFPAFAFLIAEGFAHTRNRQRYCFTLLGFAIISEIPWLLLSGHTVGHNVMFMLTLGVLSLQALDKLSNQKILALGIIAFYSFIGNLYKKVQDPNLIASMSGHVEGSRAFARYRAIDDEMKENVIKFLE